MIQYINIICPFMLFILMGVSVSLTFVVFCMFSIFDQPVTEKHKINVPETMNEFLDMSDDEGTAELELI